MAMLEFGIDCNQLSADSGAPTFGAIQVDITGGIGPFTATLSPIVNSAVISILDNAVTISQVPAGSYSVVIRDSRDCARQCTVNINPQASVTEICEGGFTMVGRILTAEECGFRWEPEAGLISPENSLTPAFPTETTNYQLIISDGEGGIAAIEEYKVKVNETPEVNILPNPAIVCGEDVTLSLAEEWATYNWSNPYPVPYPNDQPTLIAEYANMLQWPEVEPVYGVVVTNEAGCTGEGEIVLGNIESLDGYMDYLETQGFVKLLVDEISQESYLSETEVYDEFTQMTIVIDGQTIDVNADVGNYVYALSDVISDVKGIVDYIDEANYDCEDLPALVHSTVKSRNSEDEEYLIKFHVIGVSTNASQEFIFVKISNSTTDGQVVPTHNLYLIPLNVPNLSMTDVLAWTEFYFSLLNCTVNDNADCNSPNINIQMVEDIDQDNLYENDAISIVGNDKSEIAARVLGSFCDIYSTAGGEPSVLSWLTDLLSFESGEPFGKRMLSYVYAGGLSQEDVAAFRCNSMEELIGFFIFHATGHNSGIVHDQIPVEDLGYMLPGKCLAWELGQWPSTCEDFVNTTPLNSTSELILNTPDFVKHIHRKRFE